MSYMREALALRVMNDIGVPCQQGFYVRLFQNGAQHLSLFSLLRCLTVAHRRRRAARFVPHG